MDEQSLKEEAEARFAEDSLPFPPLPDDLASRLRRFGDHVYATRELNYGPYTMNALVAEAVRSGQTDDYAVIGFDGHGVNSWAMHYILVRSPLALFLQFAWGGAYMDADAARSDIEEGLAFAGRLQEAVERAGAQGRIAAGERLFVSVSSLDRSRWGWQQPGAEAPDWQGGDVYRDVADAVAARLAQ